MEVLSHTNWKELTEQLINFNQWREKYNSSTIKERDQMDKVERPAPKIYKNELIELDLAIATGSTPTKVDDKYSPTETFATIEDPRLKDYISYIAMEFSRSSLYYGSAKDNTRHCSLVPIFLAAHKQYNGINYEEWNKEDKLIRFAMGRNLYDSIDRWKDIPLSKEARVLARRNALTNKKGAALAATAWPYHNIKIDAQTKLPPSDLFRHIWLQTWMANVELRNEFMILDVHNWDLVPEALDAVFKPEMAEFAAPIPPKLEEELPW